MASGDPLFTFQASQGKQPATLMAGFNFMDGASTPGEAIPIATFDDTTQEYLDFYFVMPQHYAGTTGITLKVIFSAAEAAPDVVAWQAAFRRIADDAEDLGTTAHTYVYNEVVATAPSVIGEVAYDEITFTDGADMDSVVAGEYFILRITRDPTPSSGTDVTGDGRLHMVEARET